MARQLQLPLAESIVASLRAGDEVELSGTIYTGRDQACARFFDMLERNETLPIDLREQLLYFVGPTPARPGRIIGAAGPTTSQRMNKFLPALLRHGLRGFVGKGYIDDDVKAALVEYHGVYFGAIGGSGALLSSTIKNVQIVAFPELLSEAVRRLTLERFPAVVLCDSHGGDLYVQAKKAAR